jgi:hypothetical protein
MLGRHGGSKSCGCCAWGRDARSQRSLERSELRVEVDAYGRALALRRGLVDAYVRSGWDPAAAAAQVRAEDWDLELAEAHS